MVSDVLLNMEGKRQQEIFFARQWLSGLCFLDVNYETQLIYEISNVETEQTCWNRANLRTSQDNHFAAPPWLLGALQGIEIRNWQNFQ